MVVLFFASCVIVELIVDGDHSRDREIARIVVRAGDAAVLGFVLVGQRFKVESSHGRPFGWPVRHVGRVVTASAR